MLSLDDLRQALGRPDLTDEQVGKVRDFLYGMAKLLIDDYFAARRPRGRNEP